MRSSRDVFPSFTAVSGTERLEKVREELRSVDTPFDILNVNEVSEVIDMGSSWGGLPSQLHRYCWSRVIKRGKGESNSADSPPILRYPQWQLGL